MLPEGKALQSGTYHFFWLSAQPAGHPQQPGERARISLGLVPALPDRAREVEMFVEVAEGGAEGPLHWSEQVSVQDKGCPQLPGMFASPISSCLHTKLTRCCSALRQEESSSWKCLCNVHPQGSSFKNQTLDKSLQYHYCHTPSPVNYFTGVLTKWKYKMGINTFKAK